jgi:hypothetical protein
MTREKDRFRRTLGAVEMRVFLGEDANSSPKERKSYWQQMWVQTAVCRLLAQNVGSLAVIVSPSLRLLARNVGSWPNGIKLTFELLLEQLLSQFLPGFDHEREALGAPLLDPRLHTIGTCGVHDQRD